MLLGERHDESLPRGERFDERAADIRSDSPRLRKGSLRPASVGTRATDETVSPSVEVTILN
jgi:hypothetical protein